MSLYPPLSLSLSVWFRANVLSKNTDDEGDVILEDLRIWGLEGAGSEAHRPVVLSALPVADVLRWIQHALTDNLQSICGLQRPAVWHALSEHIDNKSCK